MPTNVIIHLQICCAVFTFYCVWGYEPILFLCCSEGSAKPTENLCYGCQQVFSDTVSWFKSYTQYDSPCQLRSRNIHTCLLTRGFIPLSKSWDLSMTARILSANLSLQLRFWNIHTCLLPMETCVSFSGFDTMPVTLMSQMET